MQGERIEFKNVTIPVAGMSCGSCVKQIQAALKTDPGVEAVEVTLAEGDVTVSYNPAMTQPAAIAEAIRKAGYKPGASKNNE